MTNRFAYLESELQAIKASDRFRSLVRREPLGICFEQDGKTLRNFGSNDYLGLAGDSLHTLTAAGAFRVGSGASGLVSGWTDAHEQLADAICKLENTAAAVIFPSGFAACSGAVATLARSGDLILSDRLNHASLIDGCRLSQAQCLVYPHRDMEALHHLLDQHRSSYQQVWIVTDSVFSMDGSVAPLPELCKIAATHQAELIVDEAHATGVLGDHGSGLCEHDDVKEQVAIRTGTLSKAIGVQGGFVAGPKPVINYLVNRCRTLIYSTALSPALAKIATQNIGNIGSEPQRRNRVQFLASRIRRALHLPTTHLIEEFIPIIPLVYGDEVSAIQASRGLFDQGYYVPAIRPPTVPKGTSRLRISVSSAHTDDMVDGLIAAIKSNV